MSTHVRRLGPQAGFSLVEMMIAVVMVGLLMAMAMPKVRDTLIRSEVQSARAAVSTLFARARIYAVQHRKPAMVHLNATSGWVTTPDGLGGIDTVGAVLNLTNSYGVAVTYNTATLRFLPTGLANAAVPLKVTVARGGKSDSVVVSGYGRLK